MLTCHEVAERASALIDGELPLWDAVRMRLHLAMCRGCGRFIDQVRKAERLVAASAAADPEPGGVDDDARLAELLLMLRDHEPRDRRGGQERKDTP